MLSSLLIPSKTIRIFSPTEYFRRVFLKSVSGALTGNKRDLI